MDITASRTHSKDGVFKCIAVMCEPLGVTHYSPLSILEKWQAGRQAGSSIQQAYVLRNSMLPQS